VQRLSEVCSSVVANSTTTRVCFLELPIAPEYGEKQILFEHRRGVLQLWGSLCEYNNNFGVAIKLAIQMHLQVANH
jgi:hypothetical protein